MTMLTTVQYFCRRTGLSVPTTVIGTTDEQILQVLSLLEEEGNDLAKRGDWERITFEATHTTVATESQGAITSIATNGYRRIKPNTFWDRTENLPIDGINARFWQAEKGFSTTSPRYRVRIRGGNLIVTPTPPAGNTWAFEYISKNWILDNDGSTYKQYFTEDTDDILLPEDVVLMGLRWRWKKEKGFDYEEDFNTYEMMVNQSLGGEGIRNTIQMDGRAREPGPGIVISQGSWTL